MIREPTMMAHCKICGTTEGLHWCGQCNVFLCDRCRTNYPARIRGAVQKMVQTLVASYSQWRAS